MNSVTGITGGSNFDESQTPTAAGTSSDNHFVITSARRSGSRDEAAAAAAAGTSDSSDRDDNVMTAYWRRGKFGAACYNTGTCELSVLEEIADRAPEHAMMCALVRQTRPALVLADKRLHASLARALPQHINLRLLPTNEYKYEACKRRIYQLRLPHEPRDASEDERRLFLSTVLNFAHALSVHALGALLKHLDGGWSDLAVDAHTRPQFMALRVISLANIVTMDDETYKGLQIFSALSHPSNFKKGTQGSGKEGLSLYHLFNKCSSKVGASLIKVMMQHPTHDTAELNKRQDVIAFCNKPQNDVVVKGITSSLKFVKNVTAIMAKIKSLSAKPFEWKSLYNTLYHTVLICEMCENRTGSQLIEELGSSDNRKLYEVALLMNRIIDFEESTSEGKFTVKSGVDPELDKKKLVMASLHGLMSETAKLELVRLPEFIEECTMVYIPHLGYLLGVKAWADNLTAQQKELPDLKFMFQNHDYIHYKSKGCQELDVMIGDTYPEITAHETRIMMRLASVVMDHTLPLAELVSKCAELDCLIAMSKVCREFGYARPKMTEEKAIRIKRGRHPLHVICTETFVPNDTVSTEEDGFVKIITGANSCGKSVYLKQVALIVYLAHIGCFVPAESAEIGVISRLHTRIQSAECVASHMSAFLIDLRQMASATQECTSRSLVIIDEFGKGTSEVDGLALLSACLNTFIAQEEQCPHVFISTHFLNVDQYVLETPLVKFLSFEHMFQDGELIFLFKLCEGSVRSSLAHEVAIIAGIDERIVARAKRVMQCKMKLNTLPDPLPGMTSKMKNITKTTIQRLLFKEM